MSNDISKTAKDHQSARQEVQQADWLPFEALTDSWLVALALLCRKWAHRTDASLGSNDDQED